MRERLVMAVFLATLSVACSLAADLDGMSSGLEEDHLASAPARESGDERPDASVDVASDGHVEASPLDGSIETSTKVIYDDVPAYNLAVGSFTTPNGAVWSTSAAGTTIIGYSAAANHHPIIMAASSPIATGDYDVDATIDAVDAAEYGIVVRAQSTGAAVSFATRWGGEARPTIAMFNAAGAEPWNPAPLAQASSVRAFESGARHRVKVRVAGALVSGKVWREGGEEPAWQVSAASPWSSGGGVGFYTYFTSSCVLEQLTVRAPTN